MEWKIAYGKTSAPFILLLLVCVQTRCKPEIKHGDASIAYDIAAGNSDTACICTWMVYWQTYWQSG